MSIQASAEAIDVSQSLASRLHLPSQRRGRKEVPAPRPAFSDRLEDCSRAIAVLNVCTVNDKPHHSAKRVDDNMTLATFDLLACIIARNPTAFSGFETLSIDHCQLLVKLPSSPVLVSP